MPKALWNGSQQITLNIAMEPSVSSVFPFNRKLQEYIDPYLDKRRTRETTEVQAISLDDFSTEFEIPRIDFIKLDIHGSEYQVLEGSQVVLENTLGLLIESWVLPIHLGQKIRASVELLAYENGFYVFEEFHRSEWARKGNQFGKGQLVALDTLYFKDPILDENVVSLVDSIKLIGMADLFEHHAYALQLAEYFHEKEILDHKSFDIIIDCLHINCKSTLKEKVFLKMLSFAKRRFLSCSFK